MESLKGATGYGGSSQPLTGKQRLGMVLMGIGDGLTNSNTLSSYMKLRQDAETWKTEQQTKFTTAGWKPMLQAPGPLPQDTQYIEIPGAGQYFKTPDPEETTKKLIAEAKGKAFQAMSPEAQAQYALNPEGKGGPTWKQEQEVEAIRAGLQRGKVVLGKEFGDPSIYEVKSIDDAISAITERGYSPDLFRPELERFTPVMIKDRKGKPFSVPQYQLQQVLDQKDRSGQPLYTLGN